MTAQTMALLSARPAALFGRSLRLAQEWRIPLLYAAFALAVFLVALVATLPHEEIARRAVAEATAGAPVAVDFRAVSMAFPNGYRFTDVRVVPQGRLALGPIRIPDLTVSTPLMGLLLGRAESANFSGTVYGGDLAGSAGASGTSQNLVLALDDLDLAKVSADLVTPPGRISGKASIDLELQGDGRTLQSTKGDVRLNVADLALSSLSVTGITIPDLTFATVDGVATVRGSRLAIESLRTTGDLHLDATGTIILREPIAQSMLDLRVKIEAPPNARPAIRVLMAVLPKRAPGEAPLYTLRGTVGAPQLR